MIILLGRLNVVIIIFAVFDLVARSSFPVLIPFPDVNVDIKGNGRRRRRRCDSSSSYSSYRPPRLIVGFVERIIFFGGGGGRRIAGRGGGDVVAFALVVGG
jgi:hypothetical protein